MTKLVFPLLSFSARGTIADSLTFQKKGVGTIVREKPIPTYTKTLPQQYQRWLYEDYCYLWQQQTSLVKATYAVAASRHHTTAISEWLKHNLTLLPDIALYLPLDAKVGSLVLDHSHFANNGTVYGAVITAGLIDHALYFDGLNDYVDCGNNQAFNIRDTITMEGWFNPNSALGNYAKLIAKKDTYGIERVTTNVLRGIVYVAGAARYSPSVAYTPNVWAHWMITYSSATRDLCIFKNGVYQSKTTLSGLATYQIDLTSNPFLISSWGGTAAWYKGLADNVVLYSRILDASEALRHSERRYPIQ